MLSENTKTFIINRILMVIVPLLLTLSFLSLSGPAVNTFAQEDSGTQPTVISTTSNYEFTAEPNDSLTKLVRKALLIFDEANEEISLTEAGIIFAETNIVQDMGSRQLLVGEEVVIRGQVIVSYAVKSVDMTEGEIAAWSRYIPGVDFELKEVQNPKNFEDIAEEIREMIEDDLPSEDVPSSAEGDSAVSAIWWLAGIASVSIVFYLLFKRED